MNKALRCRFRRTASLLALAILLVGCTTVTPIKKILGNPRDYDEKTVTISGRVTDVMGLVFLKYFVVRDKTGEITVITKRPLPNKGSEIKVTGTVKETFAIGDKQSIVIVENEPKNPS
jgi:aspartyl/asparaginyl-tRNA synthetase